MCCMWSVCEREGIRKTLGLEMPSPEVKEAAGAAGLTFHQQCMRVPVSPFYSHLSQLDSVRLFPSFLTTAAFDKVVIDNIKVPEFRVCC